MANGADLNGTLSWKLIASIFGMLLLALFTWAATGTVDQVHMNSRELGALDKRVSLIEESQKRILKGQDDIIAGQKEIIKSLNKD